MIYPNCDDGLEAGLDAIMFPVEETKVFADADRGGVLARAPAHKAIVNADTGKVVSVVGRQYQVLLNRDAVELARWACTIAFPATKVEAWRPRCVEAPSNGGSCVVDLHHEPPQSLTKDWQIAPGIVDEFEPFLRVRNGYNGRTAFSLAFGFERLACENGMLAWHGVAGLKVAHDTRDIAAEIERKIRRANFERVAGRFQALLSTLWGTPVPRQLFWPIIQLALKFPRPQKASDARWPSWADLRAASLRVSDRYADEFGDTAYALMNTLSDLATRPPQGNPFIRRGRDRLQRLASAWLREFGIRAAGEGFEVGDYLGRQLGADAEPATRRFAPVGIPA